MKAETIDTIPQGIINIDNIDEYTQKILSTTNDLKNYDIPEMLNILDKPMRIISASQPSNPEQGMEQGMVWFKLFNI